MSKTITVIKVANERAEDQILAPNSHNHGHVATAFAWS